MTRRRKVILILSILTVFLAAWLVGGLLSFGWLTRPIPFEMMWVVWEDVDGTATMETEKFTVTFEGNSRDGRIESGLWTYEGCYFRWAPWKNLEDDLKVDPDGAVESTGYSVTRRMFAANYAGHTIRFQDYKRLLVVDGREFPLDGGPVHVVIAPSGEMRLAPFVPSEMIAAMKGADRTKAP